MEQNNSIAIKWNGTKLTLLDQTRLPGEKVFFEVTDLETAVDAVKTLKVRGAPAIGVAAAYALYVVLSGHDYRNSSELSETAGNAAGKLKGFFYR